MMTTDWSQAYPAFNLPPGEINKKAITIINHQRQLSLSFYRPPQFHQKPPQCLTHAVYLYLLSNVWTVTDVPVYAECQTSLWLRKMCSLQSVQCNLANYCWALEYKRYKYRITTLSFWSKNTSKVPGQVLSVTNAFEQSCKAPTATTTD